MTNKTKRIAVRIDLTVDVEAYALEYGIAPELVPSDLADYVTSIVAEHLRSVGNGAEVAMGKRLAR